MNKYKITNDREGMNTLLRLSKLFPKYSIVWMFNMGIIH